VFTGTSGRIVGDTDNVLLVRRARNFVLIARNSARAFLFDPSEYLPGWAVSQPQALPYPWGHAARLCRCNHRSRVAQLLNLRVGAPLLRIRQVIYSSKTKPVIYVIGFYRSERHSLFIRRLR